MEKNLEDWQRIIQVRSLVVSPEEEYHTSLKFASLCRKNGRQNLALRTLVRLLEADTDGGDPCNLPLNRPHVTMAYLKHLWKEGKQVCCENII